MGQKLGKAPFCTAAKPFLNLSLPSIEALWEAFNDLADGFGVSLYEFKEIMAELTQELGYNRVKIDEKATALFGVLDQDKNGLVDGIEFISTLAAVSGLRTKQLLEFIFTCYDFDGTSHLTLDEVTLAMKGTITGLCKLSAEKAPLEEELEMLALEAFEGCHKKDNEKLAIPDLISFCVIHPEIKSWLEYYNDAEEAELVTHDVLESEIDYIYEAQFPERAPEVVAATEDDNFMVVKQDSSKYMSSLPWVDTIKNLTPAEYAGAHPVANAPDACLRLEWIHGYRSLDCRNNVFYAVDGSVVYHAARVGIVYDPLQHKQRFMMEHMEDIVSFALHPEGQLVATGEAGAHPKILVWDVLSMRVVSTLGGFHKQAVIHLAFSQNGRFLASIGQDKHHSLAIYDWKEGKLVFTARTTTRKVLGVVFGEEDQLVTCGINHIFFWSKEGRGMIKKRGIFGHRGRLQPIVSVVSSGSRIVSGTVSGAIYMWVGRNCAKAIKAHMGSVNALHASKTNIISGGKDMRVRLWTLGLEPGPTFNMASFGINPGIRSVAMSADALRILIGTRGAEIYEISSADGSDTHGGPVTIGHFESSLAGLAVHPSKSEFATVGDDKTVRIWDVPTKTMIRMATLDSPGRTIDYSPDGAFLVVGLGAPDLPDPFGKFGAYVVLNEGDLTLLHEARDSTKPILDAKFSPNGQTLAIASSDNTIYLYAPAEEFELIARCRRHTHPVMHIDFSSDSDWIQSNCEGNELYFLNAEKGHFNSDVVAMKDMQWATQTCTMGWPTQCIYPTELDGSRVLCVDRSNTGEVLSVGDDVGRIRVYQYPCVVKGALWHECRGHSKGVSKLKFVQGDSHMISVGQEDRCVFQWKFEEDDEIDDADVIDESESEGYKADMKDGSDLDRPEMHDKGVDEFEDIIERLPPIIVGPPTHSSSDSVSTDKKSNSTSSWMSSMAGMAKGLVSAVSGSRPSSSQAPVVDIKPALPPWMEGVVGPTDAPKSNPTTPADGLDLEWVQGYRGHDSRNNLRYTAEGNVVYPAAGLGVVLNPTNYTQRYNMDHTDEVICLAIDPTLKYCATGQVGRKPAIVIWEADTGETVQILRGFHSRAVSQLAFSPDGRYLASVGQDRGHSLAVYEWKVGALRAKTLGSQRKVLALAYDPNSKVILQAGLKHVTFWEHDGRNLHYRKGIIGRLGLSQTFVSATYVGTTPVVGTADGHIYLFRDYHLERSIQAHTGAVYALHSFDGGLLTGGKDGIIKKWDVDFECTATFDSLATSSTLSLNPRIRSLCLSPDKRRILIGTAGCEIFEMSALNGVEVHDGPLISGHYLGEAWGMALHPKRSEYATVGDDGVVRIWNVDSRKCIRTARLQTASRALAYHPLGKYLVAGLGRGRKGDRLDGGFVVLDPDKLTVVHEARDTNEWVHMVKFSPDGGTLALTSQDNKVYLYNVKDMFSKRYVLTSHRAVVTHLDFSEDSQYLQSADAAGVLNYTDMVTGMTIPSAMVVRDVKWKSWTLPIGWPVQGAWPVQRPQDGSQPITVDRSHKKDLLVLGDSFGRLKLYHYPVRDEEAAFRYFRGHGAQIRKVVWTKDDTHVLSFGGQDKCVLQWRHHIDLTPESGDEGGESGDDDQIDIDCGQVDKSDPPRESRDKPRPVSNGDGPWRGAVIPPTKIPEEVEGPPRQSLVLEYMHGYRGEDVRNSVRYNPQNQLVWHGAALGVIYDPIVHRQSFYQGHRHDVISMAVTEDGKYVATGEAGATPRVRIWDSSAGMEITVLSSVHERGISALAFSQDGRYLASVGHDRHHTVAIHRSFSGLWADATRVAVEKSTSSKVLFCLFCGEQNFPLMLGGVKLASFLYMSGKSLRVKKGLFGAHNKVQPLLCGTFLYSQDVVVTGTVSGQLYLWKDRKVIRSLPAHIGPVYALEVAELGLITGGKDGMVKLWNRDLTVTRQFSMMDCDPRPYLASVHSVCCNRNFTKIAVGMKGGEIYEIAISSGKRVIVTEGHSKKQLHGLATNPSNPDQYATIGDDGVLRVWSLKKKKAVKRVKLDGSSRALAWSHDGSLLVVGFGASGGNVNITSKDGAFAVVNIDMETIFEDRKAKMTIVDAKFSHDDSLVALASEDCRVYIHDRAKNYSLKAMSQKLSDEVKWVDFSQDGNFLAVGTASAELALIRVSDGYLITMVKDHRDTEWDTITVPYGWGVQGVWPRETIPPGSFDVLSVDRSHDKELLAASLADGEVRLYHYPCATVPNTDYNKGQGHGQKATKVRFSAKDDYVISLDGLCGTVLEYKVETPTIGRAMKNNDPTASHNKNNISPD